MHPKCNNREKIEDKISTHSSVISNGFGYRVIKKVALFREKLNLWGKRYGSVRNVFGVVFIWVVDVIYEHIFQGHASDFSNNERQVALYCRYFIEWGVRSQGLRATLGYVVFHNHRRKVHHLFRFMLFFF